jgi:hypothetical protein
MPKSVVPQLDLNQPVAENNSDKMVALLKFLMFNPGWISSWYDDHLLSMKKSMAQYTEDSDKLVPAIQAKLNEAISHYYPGYSCSIEIERDEFNPADYSMIISITNEYGIPVVQLDRIKRDTSGLFKFVH